MFRKSLNAIFILSIMLFVSAIYFSCTFEDVDTTPLTIERIDALGDTVMPWPTLRFVFSKPLADSATHFVITPDPGSIYHSVLSLTGDTLELIVTGILAGSKSYTAKPSADLLATNGSVLKIADASFSFYTFSVEQNPNDDASTADTLFSKRFGTINPVNDTDYFCIPEVESTSVLLINHFRQCGMTIVDENDSIIKEMTGFNDSLKHIFSKNSTGTCYIKVFSLLDNDSRYEISVLQ